MERLRALWQRLLATWGSGTTVKLGIGYGALCALAVSCVGCLGLVLVIPMLEETGERPPEQVTVVVTATAAEAEPRIRPHISRSSSRRPTSTAGGCVASSWRMARS
jgi:hypothetical protein